MHIWRATSHQQQIGSPCNLVLRQGEGSYWSGVVKIGGKSQRVDFDTGSGNILLDADAYTPGSTAINTHKRFFNGYGVSSNEDTFEGYIYLDTFSSGKLKLSNVSIGRELLVARGIGIVTSADQRPSLPT